MTPKSARLCSTTSPGCSMPTRSAWERSLHPELAKRAYLPNVDSLTERTLLYRKILRLRVVEDDRGGRLLGVELVFFAQGEADLGGAQKIQ